MPRLCLTIELKQNRFVVAESLPIEVILENNGASSVEVPDPLVGSEFDFAVTSRNDPRVEYHFSWVRAVNERNPLETPHPRFDLPGIQLAPGARQVYNEDLAKYEVTPLPPGAYTLVVEYKESRSNEETITIISPEPPEGR
jgi:hypothetical protein